MTPDLQKAKRKRLLIAAAIFIFPVAAIIVAITALLHPHKKDAPKTMVGSAFNTEFPAPILATKEKNKLEIYMQAQEDSAKKEGDRAKDPYTAASGHQTTTPKPGRPAESPSPDTRPGVVTSPFQDENSKKVSDRLEKLYAVIGNTQSAEGTRKPQETVPGSMGPDGSAEIAKLQKLMDSYQKADTATSPQLNQVKQVLDEIKEIQNPQKSPKNPYLPGQPVPALPVAARPPVASDSDIAGPPVPSANVFLGLDEDPDASPTAADAIQAVIHSDQVVQTGSIVKLRLLQPIYVGGQKIPANAFIYGPASIAGERVSITLTNAIYNGKIYPIALKVFDGSDGLDGLYVPGMITRDVVKQNMSQGVGGVELAELGPSAGAQAAAAAIETTKSILSKKIAIVKATLKAGHLAILKPTDIH
jgi:conjugative transposon TraM protein